MATTSDASVAERVAAGARWLDEHRPGWDREIDLGRLDIRDECNCVIGQQLGDFFNVYEENAVLPTLICTAPSRQRKSPYGAIEG